jgi:hypothetical protein
MPATILRTAGSGLSLFSRMSALRCLMARMRSWMWWGRELVERDVAEVGEEVEVDVAGVAAFGVLVDVQVGEPGGQVLGQGGYPGEGAAGLQALPDGVEVGQGAGGASAGLQQVTDLDQAPLVASGEAQQLPGEVQLLLRGGAVVEPGGAELAASAVGGLGEFDLVGPVAVVGVPGPVGPAELRAVVA